MVSINSRNRARQERQTATVTAGVRNPRVWEPAPATDLSNIFLNVGSMEIEGGLVKWNVKTGRAGKPSTRVIHKIVQLEIIEEYS